MDSPEKEEFTEHTFFCACETFFKPLLKENYSSSELLKSILYCQ